MKNSIAFALSSLVGLMAGLPAPTLADDTDIYLGSSQITGEVKPNVLFILDTSGSMSTEVSGTGMDRLANMQLALNTILDESNNINVGLMRYTDPGGPVLFPVSYIDEDAAVIEGASASTGADVVVKIARSTDDAEELDYAMSLTDGELNLGIATPSSTTVDVRTSIGADVGEENLASGNVSISGDQIDMNQNQVNGVRFQNVDIPQGAEILDAYIDFTAAQNDTGNLTLTFNGEASDNAAAFASASTDVSSRPTTSAAVDWSPPNWSRNSTYTTPDLAGIVQEIVCRGVTTASTACPGAPYAGAWTQGNAMAFIHSHDGGNKDRRAYTHNGASGNTGKQPRLRVTYAQPASSSFNTVGLRFQNVAIPQGATINSASIKFTATQDSNDPSAAFLLSGELAEDPTTYTGATGDISYNRAPTSANAEWNSSTGLTEWVTGNPYTTPDLSAIIQELVDQPSWCGNNSMAFMINYLAGAVDARVAQSFDGDQTGAPVLSVDYDEDTIPASGGCINDVVQYQISSSSDDAEETTSTGGMDLNSGDLDMISNRTNGLRFQNVQIPQGATILEAKLIFTADEVDTGSASFTYQGQLIADAPAFTAASGDISNRTVGTASVSDTPEDWDTIGSKYSSADIGPVIQEILNQADWAPGNALAIIQTQSSGSRHAETYDSSPALSPVLQVNVQYTGTAVPGSFTTVRDRLKQIVDSLPHRGYTPIVGTLYEAAQYWMGGPVTHGKARSHRDSDKSTTRVSHDAAYTDGTHVYPPGCTVDNLGSSDCDDEQITGTPNYISPIQADQSCAGNYIVLLSDGIANHNANEDGFDHGVSLVETLVGGSCAASDDGEKCGRELASFLHTEDLRSDLSGDQVIDKIFSIGFNLEGNAQAVTFLQDLATNGGGEFKEASNAAQLADVFQGFIADILNQPTSFATPSLSVNVFNKLFHRNEVYFSLFEPSSQYAWEGNVKKYRICDLVSVTDCTLGEILDTNDSPAVGSDNRIRDDATSIWSDQSQDGVEIREGGAGREIPNYTARTVYTYTGSTAPSNENLDVAAHTITETIPDTVLTKAMLGDAAMTDADRTSLIQWILGKDVDDNFDDSEFGSNRFAFEDPLHASPAVVTLGGTEANPIDKFFVATNGGGLRLVNGVTGKEEWMFIPQELLGMQKDLRANGSGDHIYGLDLTPSLWVNDENDNGIIAEDDDSDDFVRVIVGMRRGGNDIYAIDATPGVTLTDPTATTGAEPIYMWHIDGGSADFPNLGETWSSPKPTTISIGSGANLVAEDVVIFGGGNDPALDIAFGPSSGTTIGNIVYIVDAETGTEITSIGGPSTSAKLKVTGMEYPIVSDLALLDSDGDRRTDRIYFGDLGGQVWRIDLADDVKSSSTGSAVGIAGKLGDISLSTGAVPGPLAAETRSFYSALDVVQVDDAVFSTDSRYDLILLVSGNRPDPLDTDVHNTFYAFRDYAVNGMVDANNDGMADSSDYPTIVRGSGNGGVNELFDVTGNPFQTDDSGQFVDSSGNPIDSSDPTLLANLDAMRQSSGWFIDLKESDGSYIGEKGLSRPVVLAGKLFFTTYVPEVTQEQSSQCEQVEGFGRLYGLNVLSGAALFADWDSPGDTTHTKADRVYTLGGGIPSDAIPIFQKKGVTIIVGSGGGATSFDPGIDLPRERTYWWQ